MFYTASHSALHSRLSNIKAHSKLHISNFNLHSHYSANRTSLPVTSNTTSATPKFSLSPVKMPPKRVDFPSTTERANRFLRNELQYQVFIHVDSYDTDDWGFENCREQVETLFKREIQKSDHGHAYNGGDSELLSAMERVIDPKIQGIRWKVPTIMKALELRGKIQSAFFSVFMHLNNLCLVSYEGLRTPMRLSHATNDDIGSLMGCLNCFTGIREFTHEWAENFTFLKRFSTASMDILLHSCGSQH